MCIASALSIVPTILVLKGHLKTCTISTNTVLAGTLYAFVHMVLSQMIQLPAEIVMVTFFGVGEVYTAQWFHYWNPQDNAKMPWQYDRKLAACIFSHWDSEVSKGAKVHSLLGSALLVPGLAWSTYQYNIFSCCCRSLLLSPAPLVPSQLPSLLACSSCEVKLSVHIRFMTQYPSRSVLIRTLHCMHQNVECSHSPN